MTTGWVDLLDLSVRSRAQARQVYEAGFPLSVRAPFEDLVGRRADERAQVLLDDRDGADVLGLTVVRDLRPPQWSFLRYFVVTASRRGQGLGSRLWAALTDDLLERGRTLLAFDVEDPDSPGLDPAEERERRRRVGFYERLGAAMPAVADYAPPEHGSGGTAPALRLMAARLDAPGGAVVGAELDRLLAAVYRDRYGIDPQAVRRSAALPPASADVGRAPRPAPERGTPTG